MSNEVGHLIFEDKYNKWLKQQTAQSTRHNQNVCVMRNDETQTFGYRLLFKPYY